MSQRFFNEGKAFDHLNKCRSYIKSLNNSHRNTLKEGLAESCACTHTFNGQLPNPQTERVRSAEDVGRGANLAIRSLLSIRMALTTSMAREYISFLEEKEITKAEFENRVNKRRHKDKFGFEPTVGDYNANCYTYAAIFQLWETEPMDMPILDLSF